MERAKKPGKIGRRAVCAKKLLRGRGFGFFRGQDKASPKGCRSVPARDGRGVAVLVESRKRGRGSI